MKLATIALTGAMMVASAAHAENFALSASQAFAIEQGLAALSVPIDMVVPASPGVPEKTVKTYFEFTPAFRLLVARDLFKIETFVKTTQTAGKAASIAAAGEEPKTDADKARGTAALEKVFDAPQEIELERIDLDDLDLSKNAVQPSAIALIMPIAKTK